MDGFRAGHPRASTWHVLRRNDEFIWIITGGLSQNIRTGALEFVVLAVKGGVVTVAKRTAHRGAFLVCAHPVLTATGAVKVKKIASDALLQVCKGDNCCKGKKNSIRCTATGV